MLHFGWFVGRGYSPHNWNQKWTGTIGDDWWSADLYIDLARALERASFDYILIEDGSFIADAFQDSPEWYLHHAYSVPKSDPMPLVPLLGQATTHLGIVATTTSTFYPPYIAARLGATLDHLTRGGWASTSLRRINTARRRILGSTRCTSTICATRWPTSGYEVCKRLWESWEPDAIVADPETGVFADYTKIHPINFQGRFFKCRGPLNTAPGQQRQPVICQAGGSPAGRNISALKSPIAASAVFVMFPVLQVAQPRVAPRHPGSTRAAAGHERHLPVAEDHAFRWTERDTRRHNRYLSPPAC